MLHWFSDENISIVINGGKFIEGEIMVIHYIESGKKRKTVKAVTRTVKFSPDAKDLYIKVNGKKYFYSEFTTAITL